jgi:hypothetical protein
MPILSVACAWCDENVTLSYAATGEEGGPWLADWRCPYCGAGNTLDGVDGVLTVGPPKE